MHVERADACTWRGPMRGQLEGVAGDGVQQLEPKLLFEPNLGEGEGEGEGESVRVTVNR